jgi:hypothetical protein
MKTLYLFLLSLLVMCGCSPSNPPVGNIVSGTIDKGDVYVFMETNRMQGSWGEFIVDTNYALPTKHWIIETFSTALAQHLMDNNLSYENQVFDCDDFVDEAIVLGRRLYKKSNEFQRGSSLAIGKFYFRPTFDKGHAVNCFLVNENGRAKILFYEPQQQKMISLSQEEVFSVSFWSF